MLLFCGITTLLLSLVMPATVTSSLGSILKSSQGMRTLYNSWKEQHDLSFSADEDTSRLKVFQTNLAKVVDCDVVIETAQFAVNKFAVMTEEEQKAYGGYNVSSSPWGPPQPITDVQHPPIKPTDTQHPPIKPTDAQHPPIKPSDAQHPPIKPSDAPDPPIKPTNSPIEYEGPPTVPDSKLWTDSGSVTLVQNQGDCGACWTFAAVGVLETRYKTLTGVLKKFSEQELLDCSQERNNGCYGGYPESAMKYVMKEGRLAAESYYRYKEGQGECKTEKKSSALKAARVVLSTNLPPNLEDIYVQFLSEGPIWVATTMTDCLKAYSGGIMRDTTCTEDQADHIVTAVGYTPSYMLIKNSWGSDWGEEGFVRFARGYHNCGMWLHGGYVKLESTGKKDKAESDEAAVYRVREQEEDCSDEMVGCGQDNCASPIGAKVCKKTCGGC